METQLESASEALTKLKDAIDAWNAELVRDKGLPDRQKRDLAAAYVDFIVSEKLQYPQMVQAPPDNRLSSLGCHYSRIIADVVMDVMVNRLAAIKTQRHAVQTEESIQGTSGRVEEGIQDLLQRTDKDQ